MAALDWCQDVVIRALQKDGWRVRPHGKRLISGRRIVTIDVLARKGRRRIYVEIKCFPDPRDVDEQYHALGQYLIYRAVLIELGITAKLYLAFPVTMYRSIDSALQTVLNEQHVRCLVFDEAKEEIVQWIEP